MDYRQAKIIQEYFMNPEKSVEEISKEILIPQENIFFKEKRLIEVLSAERSKVEDAERLYESTSEHYVAETNDWKKKVEELEKTIANLDNKGVAWIAEVYHLKSELKNCKSTAWKLKEALVKVYVSNNEYFRTEIYQKALAEYERIGK
jgi:chromosome segregation ATPase